MQRYVTLQKRVGQTPLQAIEEWKRANPGYGDVPASYAGRLDPMAEGLLLILLGDECKRQERYRGLDKEYVIEIALDLSTDTGDVLGIPTYIETETRPTEGTVRSVLTAQIGTHSLPYPSFSSKTVNGKPLFLHALEGTLSEITIPEHEETIYRITLEDIASTSKEDLSRRIQETLLLAPRTNEPSKALGRDFRQDAIRTEWNQVFEAMPDRRFSVLRLRVTSGSGAYMRTLAERIGKTLGTNALALSICRTRIGRYLPIGNLGFWFRSFA